MTQLTFDSPAGDTQPAITLAGVARDIYLDTCQDLGINTQDKLLLSKLALRQLGMPARKESGRSPAAIAADWLLMEILYGCEFLQDPEGARDPYSDASWLLLLAQIGATALMETCEPEWVSELAAEQAGHDAPAI